MKIIRRMGWFYLAILVAGLVLASCGNSQKNKVQSDNQVQQPVGTVIEESEVVVQIDSIAPDFTAQPGTGKK